MKCYSKVLGQSLWDALTQPGRANCARLTAAVRWGFRTAAFSQLCGQHCKSFINGSFCRDMPDRGGQVGCATPLTSLLNLWAARVDLRVARFLQGVI